MKHILTTALLLTTIAVFSQTPTSVELTNDYRFVIEKYKGKKDIRVEVSCMGEITPVEAVIRTIAKATSQKGVHYFILEKIQWNGTAKLIFIRKFKNDKEQWQLPK